jgi:hypothetical protein
MILTIEFDHELDGRSTAPIAELAGAHIYGEAQDPAMARAQVPALEVLAGEIEHGEGDPTALLTLEFVPHFVERGQT